LNFKFFTKVICFTISNEFSSGDKTVVRFAWAIVSTVGACMKIDFTMGAKGAKTDLHGGIANQFRAFPAVHRRDLRGPRRICDDPLDGGGRCLAATRSTFFSWASPKVTSSRDCFSSMGKGAATL